VSRREKIIKLRLEINEVGNKQKRVEKIIENKN
jgi:hypothetical protein